MCGIGTITLSKTAAPDLDLEAAAAVLLEVLQARGEDASGLLTISAGGGIDVQKAVCDARTFNRYRRPVQRGTRALAVHTRFATQGPAAFNRNNHPVACGPALVVHNGVIWENEKRQPGQPEVDTYVLAIEAKKHALRKKGESAQRHGERVAAALSECDGSAAVGVAFRSQPFLVTARLYGSPLYVAEAEGVRIAASMRDAVEDAFYALGIDVPTTISTTMRTVKKAKRGRPAKTVAVETAVPAIDYAPEGYVAVWNAGTHTAGTIALDYTYSQTTGGYSYAQHYTYPKPRGADRDSTYGGIAARLLESGNAERCELCDTWSDGTLPVLWGMRCCDECAAAMRVEGAGDDPDTEDAATDNGAAWEAEDVGGVVRHEG